MLSVGICALVRNEARYIQEWVAFHSLQGVSRILVFDNGSSDGTPDLLRSARPHSGIEVIDRPGGADAFDALQRQTYQEGASMLAGKVDMVLFIDADEFVHADGGSLGAAFAALPSVGAVAIGQRVFGSSGQRRFQRTPVTLRFTQHLPDSDPESRWFKTAARPELIERFDSVHSVVLRSGRYVMADGSPLVRSGPHPGCADHAVKGWLHLNHYMLKSREEYRLKQRKWSSTGLASRYSEEYFTSRDQGANQMRQRPPLSRDRLDQAVARIWSGQRVPAPAERYRYGWKHHLRCALGRSIPLLH
jgi:glycosyltransferase involved in cell wall biosynthesis